MVQHRFGDKAEVMGAWVTARDGSKEILAGAETLHGGDVVPGLTCPVANIL